MYSWDYTYPNGVRTQNQLIVPAGKPVMLEGKEIPALTMEQNPQIMKTSDVCMGCHDKMGIEKGSSVIFKEGERCGACHKKKVIGPAEITKLKNENVVRQNTEIILNVWRPK